MLSVNHADASSAQFEEVTSSPFGEFGGVEYLQFTGRFVGSTSLGAFRVPFEIVTPADPDLEWWTVHTPHFRVHFQPELDSLARRAAVSAERAWSRLAAELVAPRGPVDLVVADNVDYSNGFATTFPSNRIVVLTEGGGQRR